MSGLGLFTTVFIYSAILWIVVLAIYSALVESLDFGRLSYFALQSGVLVAAVAAVVTFVPGGNFLTPLVWGAGLVVIMRSDLWQALKLLSLLWAVSLLAWLVIYWAVLSGQEQTPLSGSGVLPQNGVP